MNEGLKQAIERAGGTRKLAKMLGITRQAIEKWTSIPARHIIVIERLTGVPREKLRPDLYR